MNQALDLSIVLVQPPPDSPTDVIASITLHCDALGLSHFGDLLRDPLTPHERDDLRWYLEEYWKWPYEGFALRGKQVEDLLVEVGKRLYEAIFGHSSAKGVVQAWQQQPDVQRQISITSNIPGVLSLPWELLHDADGFLALHKPVPVSIVRRLPQSGPPAEVVAFELPLRILLVTARPEDAGFVDPRSIAHGLLDTLEEHIAAGTIELEFLRPATMSALRERLKNTARPIHVLHFDGHGQFDEREKQGMLAFEDEDGLLDRVKAQDLAQVLQESGVLVVILNSCQSAQGAADDAFSSVAAQLLRSGVDAVVAMSASILVTSATRYVEAFYRALVGAFSIPMAQQQARQALYEDPHRDPMRRYRDEEGISVKLYDWWLPHFYQRRPIVLQSLKPGGERAETQQKLLAPRFSEQMPPKTRYGFSGRARELHRIERLLLRGKLVILSGFGGVGKTALVREAADWLTRTGMYERACFVSFDRGGDAMTLLDALGSSLGIRPDDYPPGAQAAVLERLKPALQKQHTLVIVDSLESILTHGVASLENRRQRLLWEALLELAKMGTGVLLTSQSTALKGEGPDFRKKKAHLFLGGLHSNDAYLLALHILTELGIDRKQLPYAGLHVLLEKLAYHPLAIELVLPKLRQLPLSKIGEDFDALLPTFMDHTEEGRNHSLVASLEYSLQRLSKKHQKLLMRLALFESGTLESNLLLITGIAQEEWTPLRNALKEAGLLREARVHNALLIPFLRFHPILMPFLRTMRRSDDMELQERFADQYYDLAQHMYHDDGREPEPVRALVRQELPNLLRALDLLLETEDLHKSLYLGEFIAHFLTIFGLVRERDELRKRLTNALAATDDADMSNLQEEEYVYERGLIDDETGKGDTRSAAQRCLKLLKRMESLPEGAPLGRGSFEYCQILSKLADCLKYERPTTADRILREALGMIDELIKRYPENPGPIHERASLLSTLGNVLINQGQYPLARKALEEALWILQAQERSLGYAKVLGQLGWAALMEQSYEQAMSHYVASLSFLHKFHDPAVEAVTWHQLGMIAQAQKEWADAESYFRKSLALKEMLSDKAGAAMTCNQLAYVAMHTKRLTEAEFWLRHAIDLDEQVHPGSIIHAGHLTNLAALLTKGIETGSTSKKQLPVARRYVEEALAITEKLEDIQRHRAALTNLALIADIEGKTEEAQEYRRRAQTLLAAIPGERSLMYTLHGPVITGLAELATGNLESLLKFEKHLKQMETRLWIAVQRILAGERDRHSLIKGMSNDSAGLVTQILETIKLYERVLKRASTSMPDTIREAYMRGDIKTYERILPTLSHEERLRMVSVEYTYKVLKDGEFWALLHSIADVATGYYIAREDLEVKLAVPGMGLFKEAVNRILAGERDIRVLTAKLDVVGAVLIQLVLDIIALQEEESTQQLTARVGNWTTDLDTNALGKQARGAFWNVPYQRNPFFTGREDLLEQLHHHFAADGSNTTSRIQAIVGPSGSGKTQLAVEYAYRHRDSYHLVLWINASATETLISDSVTIARRLQASSTINQDITIAEPGTTMINVGSWLPAFENWLLIFDDVNDELNLDQLLTGSNGHILVTTRSHALGTIADSVLVLDSMNREEGALLLLRRANELPPQAGIERATEEVRLQAEAIVRVMNAQPLALDHAGAYIKEVGCDLLTYLALYQDRGKELLEDSSKFSGGYLSPHAVMLSLSFQEVEKRNRLAAELLRFCAYLAPESIPEEIVGEAAAFFSSETGPGADASLELSEALGVLQSFALTQPNSIEKTFIIHRLVQGIVKGTMDETAQHRWAGTVIRIVNQAFPRLEAATHSRCQRLFSQVQACVNLIAQYALVSQEGVELLDKALSYIKEQGPQIEVEPLLARLSAMREQMQGARHPDTAMALNDLALLYSAQGRYEQAEPIFLRALPILEQALGPDHLKVAQCLNSLAQIYRDQQRYAEAESCYRRVLTIQERILGPDDIQISVDLANLGVLYWQQKQYFKALPLFLQSLSIDERVLGPAHLDVAKGLQNIATHCRAQGDNIRAKQFYERVLSIHEQVQGPVHLDVATDLIDLATLSHLMKEHDQAELLYLRALSLLENALEPDHLDIAQILNNLAALYTSQGEYTKAEPPYRRALSICQKSLGPDDPRTVMARKGYMALLQAMKKAKN